jgi:PAS domain S-box-containing protein
MRTSERVLPIKSNQMARVLRYLLDSLLACAGSLLVTGAIVVFHLYPAIPNISIIYLPVVLGLAVVRGRYAAILSAVVASLSLAYFIVPPLYTLAVYLDEEWIALFIFLIVAILTGQLAAALRKKEKYSERKLRTLVESNIFGMAMTDSAGRIYEVNDRFAQVVGYRKDELLSESFNWSQLVPPGNQEALEQVMKIILSTGTLPPSEGEYLRKDGSRVPVLAAGTLLDRERHLMLGVILDISEQKAAERRKQEFLSMVSHELRTPLTSIMGFIDLALLCSERFPRPLSPEAEQLMCKMETGLKRAMSQVEVETRLVEELLEVARLEMHTFELSLQRENLVTVVQETVANQQQVAHTRQIELVLPPEELVTVIADTGRIGQVLTNYLTNALKYAPVEQVVSVRLEVTGTVARVSVCDQGPGLTPEQQQRVWERFYQVAAPGLQGPDGGLGLGLAIARVIIEQHHGQVGVESAPGRGSTFWFSMPIEVSPEG